MAHIIDENNERVYELTLTCETEDVSRAKAVLAKRGASIVAERPLEKIRFAYPVKKQGYAFLGSIRFTGVPDIDGLSKELAQDGGIIRSLIHVVDTKLEEELRQIRALRAAAGGPRSFRKETTDPAVLTNEALEKKIEEILN
jgi:ribosomal protein S6